MNIILQIITTLALISGISIGEFLSTKVFGILKKSWLYIVELLIFVIIIVTILNSISLEIYSIYLIAVIYFISGFLTIIFVRGIISGLGLFSEHFKRNILKNKNELDYILGLKKALERRKFKQDDILKILKEVGFSEKNINKIINYFGIKNKKIKKKTY